MRLCLNFRSIFSEWIAFVLAKMETKFPKQVRSQTEFGNEQINL